MNQKNPEILRRQLQLAKEELASLPDITRDMEYNSYIAETCSYLKNIIKPINDYVGEDLIKNPGYNHFYRALTGSIEAYQEYEKNGMDDLNDVSRHLINAHKILEKQKNEDLRNIGKVAKGIVEAKDGNYEEAIENVVDYIKNVGPVVKLYHGMKNLATETTALEKDKIRIRQMLERRRGELTSQIQELENSLSVGPNSGNSQPTPISNNHPMLHNLIGIIAEIKTGIEAVRNNIHA